MYRVDHHHTARRQPPLGIGAKTMEQITATTDRINARLRMLKSQVDGITLGITREPTLSDLDRVQALLDRAIDEVASIFE